MRSRDGGKEAPGFLVIGLVISLAGLAWSVIKLIDSAPLEGVLNTWFSHAVLYLLVVLYFAHGVRKAMQEQEANEHDRRPGS